MLRLWIILFAVFISYTLTVYGYCDNKEVAATIPDNHALAGWKTWQENNCQTCHQIYGLGGYMGRLSFKKMMEQTTIDDMSKNLKNGRSFLRVEFQKDEE